MNTYNKGLADRFFVAGCNNPKSTKHDREVLVMLTLRSASYSSAKEKQVGGFCLPLTCL